VKFRPTYGAKEFFKGKAVNLSCEGLGLDAHDFRFFVYENLELHFDVPGNGDTVSLIGDVLWKRQAGKRCFAGIKFKIENENMQRETIGKIFSSSDIPVEDMYQKDPYYIIHEKAQKIPLLEREGPGKALSELPNKLGFIKQYYDSGTKCKVTFRLLREVAINTQNVAIVGDFNDWDPSRSPMTRLENGDFIITMDLDSKGEYKFKYLMDGLRWENDWYADKFVLNDLGSKDSVVIV
jgi:hypothetical protein